MSEKMESSGQPERPERSGARGSAWIGGAILILIGVVFLLRNVTSLELGNWWAFFILIPAIGSLTTAWRAYQASGRMSNAVRASLTGGLVLLAVTAIFLFNLDWGKVWPIFLIIAGVGALLAGL